MFFRVFATPKLPAGRAQRAKKNYSIRRYVYSDIVDGSELTQNYFYFIKKHIGEDIFINAKYNLDHNLVINYLLAYVLPKCASSINAKVIFKPTQDELLTRYELGVEKKKCYVEGVDKVFFDFDLDLFSSPSEAYAELKDRLLSRDCRENEIYRYMKGPAPVNSDTYVYLGDAAKKSDFIDESYGNFLYKLQNLSNQYGIFEMFLDYSEYSYVLQILTGFSKRPFLLSFDIEGISYRDPNDLCDAHNAWLFIIQKIVSQLRIDRVAIEILKNDLVMHIENTTLHPNFDKECQSYLLSMVDSIGRGR
jgi:hypothetical protein